MRQEIKTAFYEIDLNRTADRNFFIKRFAAESFGDGVKAQYWGYLDNLDKISAFQFFISSGSRIMDGKLMVHDAKSDKYFVFTIAEGKLINYHGDLGSCLENLSKITNLLSRSCFVNAIEQKVIVTGPEAQEMQSRLQLVAIDNIDNFPRALPPLDRSGMEAKIDYLNDRIFGNQAKGITGEAGNLFIYQGSRLRGIESSSAEVRGQLNQELPSAPDLVLSEVAIQNAPMIQKYLLPKAPHSQVPTIEALLEAKADEFNFIGQERRRFIDALTTLKYIEQKQAVGLDNFSLDETSDQQRLELLFDFIMSQYKKMNDGPVARSASTSNQINEKISIGIVEGIAESKFFEINFKIGGRAYKLQLQPDSLKYYKEDNSEVTHPEAKLLLNESLADIIKDVSRSVPPVVAEPSSVARVAGDAIYR